MSRTNEIGVVIVDDSPIVRAGLRALLDVEEHLSVVAEAGSADEALCTVATHRADCVLLDVRMPGRDGLSVVAELSSRATVIMLTFSDEPATIQGALREGASGYLVHGTFDADTLASMIRQCVGGGGAFSGPALSALRGGGVASPAQSPVVEGATSPADVPGLSARQVEVMDLVAAGRSNGQIAGELFVAEKTVKNHINAIFAALGTSTRAEAIVLWRDRRGPRGPR